MIQWKEPISIGTHDSEAPLSPARYLGASETRRLYFTRSARLLASAGRSS